jgi:hypothetical protein
VLPTIIQALPTSQTQLEIKFVQVEKQNLNLGIAEIHEHAIRSHHYGPSEILM